MHIRFFTEVTATLRKSQARNEEHSTPSSEPSLTPSQKLEMFKFYEEAAASTKSHGWTQTAWILTLNAGIIVFSLNVYLQHYEQLAKITIALFIVIEIISALVGVALCWYLYYILGEFGRHIRNYWSLSDKYTADFHKLDTKKQVR